LPWSLCTVPYATSLIAVGTVMRRFEYRIASPSLLLLLSSAIICFAVSCFWSLNMAWNQILPIIPITIGAISGTLMIFILSGYIDRHSSYLSSLLQSIGKETYIIVAFSQVIIFYLNRYFSLVFPLKYLILVMLLIIVKMCKDCANKHVHCTRL
jgi:hypothetical protein